MMLSDSESAPSSLSFESSSPLASSFRSGPVFSCSSSSAACIISHRSGCPMQNLAERVQILKYMECKGFWQMSWLLIMERKNAIDSFDHSKGRYDMWKILRVLDHGGEN